MSSTKQVLRSAKNVMRGYSSTQVLVRDATSNDNRPTNIYQLEDIASRTYDTVDFYEIMDMLDKRLNDKGKYWKHIVKSLTVLDYLVRFGSENCVMWCKENHYAIKTLREFRYIDDSGIDQGHIIRVKAKELSALLEDDERLREERRFNRGRRRPGKSSKVTSSSSQSSSSVQYQGQGYGYPANNSEGRGPIPPPYVPSPSNSTTNTRPDSRNSREEEEMDEDLRRAIEESKITAEEDEKRRKQLAQYDEEDPELQAALQLSKEEEELKQLQELQRLQREHAQMQAIQQAQSQAYIQGQATGAAETPYFDIFGNPISAEEWAGYQQQQQQWEQQQAQQQLAQEQYLAQQQAQIAQQQQQQQQLQVYQDQYGQTGQGMYQQNQYNQDQYGQNQYPQDNYAQNQYDQGQYNQQVGQQMVQQQQQQQPDYMQQPMPTGSNNPFSLANVGKLINAGGTNNNNNSNNNNNNNYNSGMAGMNDQFQANPAINQPQPQQHQMMPQTQEGQIQNQNQNQNQNQPHNQYQLPPQLPLPVQQQQQQQPLQQMRTGNSAISNKYSELNQLIGQGPDIDTFGNTGEQRIPAQHTKTGTFINSQGTGYRQVADDSKGNPFYTDGYLGLPSASMVPAQTGYGFGNEGGVQQPSNQPVQQQMQNQFQQQPQYQNQPYYHNQPQQQQEQQQQQQQPDQGVSLIDL